MRALGVVILDPARDDVAGLAQCQEQRLVQKLIPHAAVEALDIAVLHGAARRDVVPLDLRLALPTQRRVGGELGAVVADDHLRGAPFGDEIGQLAHDPTTGDRGIDHRPQALARDVVDDVGTRNRRPVASWSWTKSRPQRWLGSANAGAGARAPTARLRPRLRLTVSLSSR